MSSASGVVVPQNGHTMEMKKGKPNVPANMRGQYKRAQEMNDMRRQMEESTKPGQDGLPVFNLFVRTKKQNVSVDNDDDDDVDQKVQKKSSAKSDACTDCTVLYCVSHE